MLLQILAAALFIVLLWSLFRLAMGLRWTKLLRQAAERVELERGRRLVAELPLTEGVLLFLEDDGSFFWGPERVTKPDIAGARVLLNGAVIGSWAHRDVTLPEPPRPEPYEGRERWAVELYLRDGRRLEVRCGALREGVSREAAQAVFEAVRRGAQQAGHAEVELGVKGMKAIGE
jgi:hypothetical protein